MTPGTPLLCTTRSHWTMALCPRPLCLSIIGEQSITSLRLLVSFTQRHTSPKPPCRLHQLHHSTPLPQLCHSPPLQYLLLPPPPSSTAPSSWPQREPSWFSPSRDSSVPLYPPSSTTAARYAPPSSHSRWQSDQPQHPSAPLETNSIAATANLVSAEAKSAMTSLTQWKGAIESSKQQREALKRLL